MLFPPLWREMFRFATYISFLVLCYFCTARAHGYFTARAVLTQKSFQVGSLQETDISISEYQGNLEASSTIASWYTLPAFSFQSNTRIPLYDRTSMEYLRCHQREDLERPWQESQRKNCDFLPENPTWFTAQASQTWRFGTSDTAGHLLLPEINLPRPENPGDIFISEILWMGSYRGATSLSNDEWIELYNPTDHSWSLRGMRLLGVTSSGFYSFPTTAVVGPYSYFLVGRKSGSDTQLLRDPDALSTALSLVNTKADMALVSWNGQILDQTPSGNWQVGVNDTQEQRRCSVQRKRGFSDGLDWNSWQSCEATSFHLCHPYPLKNWKDQSEQTCGTPWQPTP